MSSIKIKRIYATASAQDGFRVFVDRLWPRGLKKEEVKFDVWNKEIAPSADLRKWFHHEPEKWEQFRKRYIAELNASEDAQAFKERIENYRNITLLYAAKDELHNHALVLRDYFQSS